MQELIFNEIAVRCDEQAETVWLNLNQMSALFGRDKSVVSKHLKNAFDDGEIEAAATVAKFATVQIEGQRQVEREVEHYNLDAILSVGYRVKSPVGTHFRRWATARLKEIMLRQQAAQREQELWLAFRTAKTGAVQLSVLAALGVPIVTTGTLPRPAAAAGGLTADKVFTALERCSPQLTVHRWLRRERVADGEDCWLLEPAELVTQLASLWPEARAWTGLTVRRALEAHPAWRAMPASEAGHERKVRFPGRPNPQRVVRLAVAAMPEVLRRW